MLYDELIRIEKMIEGNEYFSGGVSYFVGIDKLDSSLSLDLAVKNRLLELDAIRSSEKNMVMTQIMHPENELKRLCEEWHLDEKICKIILGAINADTKLYRCCDDFEYISRGAVGEIFRIIEKGKERVLIDFYIAD